MVKITKQLMGTIISELKEDSIFNPRSLKALRKLQQILDKKQNPDNLTPEELLSEETCFSLSTSRNRNLISFDKQDQLRKTVVGFFGLSVGSHAALTWMMEARADVIKIIDNDVISPTNLNRLRFGWRGVGRLKADVVEEGLLEINPHVKVIKSTSRDKQDVEGLFKDSLKIDVVVDAIDDMAGKINLRKLCKQGKIPLISAADVGDNVILDIERYDIFPQPEMFLGRLPGVEKINFSRLPELEKKKMIIKLVGFEQNSEKLLDSIKSLGITLGTWPQLGATATIAGGTVATIIKKIILGERVKSGRYCIDLDSIFVGGFNSMLRQKNRKDKIRSIEEKLGLG